MKSAPQKDTLFSLEPKKKKVWLSHSGIEGIHRCKRCFYLQYTQKIYPPEGFQSRLANRFDAVIKSYFDAYRNKDELPPIVKKQLEGTLQKPFKETYFHTINDAFGFYGKLDECLIVNGLHVPVDFKTSSSDPREKEIFPSYQHQIDEYAYLLQKNRKKIAGYGYLIFFYPDMSHTVHNGFPMITHLVKVEAHPEEVDERIDSAISILQGPLPDSSPECSFCGWFQKVRKYY